jgi:hypothetical protein
MNGNFADRAIPRFLATAFAGLSCTALLLFYGAGRARAQEAPGAPAVDGESQATAAVEPTPAEPGVDPKRLSQLVADLDNDRYAVREAAQKQLIAIAQPALDAVAEVAAKGSLESATRAVNILSEWADSKEDSLSVAALERIAALETRPIEAAMAFERLAVVREAEAVEAIKALGGRFDYDRATAGGMGGVNLGLQVIIGPQWKGGSEGLKHIANIRNATILSLHSAPLGEEAVAEIASLGQLRRIEIFGTPAPISPEGVEKLRPQLPNTMLDVRGGARLGIAGLVIERIVPDSPAAKAGLQRGDRVTEFAGTAITDFEQLTQQIAKCKPGETITMKVQRGAEALEKSVTFDRWGDDERTTMNSPELQQGFTPIQVQGGPIIFRNAPVMPLTPVPAQPEQRR